MSKRIKKTLIASVILFLIFNYFYLIHKGKDRGKVIGADNKIPETIYRPPIIPLPFVPDKQPIPNSRLPIPKKDIAKTVTITTGVGAPRTIEIIISKSGEVYFPTDTPPDVKAQAYIWKERWVHAGLSFGFSFVTDAHHQYLCLSANYLHVGKLIFGADAGISTPGQAVLLGMSTRYPLFTVSADESVSVNVTVGYNLIGKSVYGGVHLSW